MTNKVKVLLIDDDFEFVNNFGWFLERRGYDVLKAGTGDYGIEVAEKEKPHIVLCDLLLIDMNGEEVLNKVKQINPDTIFIIVSAYVDEKTKARLIGLGAHSYIEKLVKFKPTEEYIRQVLKEKGKI